MVGTKRMRKRARKQSRQEAKERRTIELITLTLQELERQRARDRASIEAGLDGAYARAMALEHGYSRSFANKLLKRGYTAIEVGDLFRESMLPNRVI